MTQIITKAVLCLVPLALLCSVTHGQDIPAVTSPAPYQGFHLPTELGTFTYSLNFSESARTGDFGTGGNTWSTNFSGDAAYLSRSVTRPFNLVYSGGYLYNSGSSIASSIFQNLQLSQSFTTRDWNVNLSDAVNYLPESPTGGLSGIPGVGDIGITAPPIGPATGQEILTRIGQRISNTTNVSVQRQLTGSTAIQGAGGYYLQRFFSGASQGIDGQNISGQANVNHRIDALNKVEGSYEYSHFSYEDQTFTFSTQKITAGYTRQISRKLSVHATAGPQIITSAGTPLAKTSINFSVNSGLAYAGQDYTSSVDYQRGVSGGSGVVQGTFTDSVFAQVGRRLGEYMHVVASGSYTHNSSIINLTTQHFDFQTVIGNLQATRTISQSFNAFISYSAQYQNSSNIGLGANVFTGTSQVFGFGITYSPRQIHLGNQ